MSIHSFKKLGICLAGLLFLTPSMVTAGADSGFYIGAGIGDAPVKVLDFDESDFAYKIFGGYNFGYVPLVDLAVEASYVDFGSPSNQSINVDVSGFNAFGLVGLNFGPIGIFAKAGLVSWDSTIRVAANRFNDDGIDPAYGIGARFQFGSLAVRAEYEYFDLDSVSDISLISASVVYTF
ncbi:MAG: porin family protein [Xanthomonadales bacterium]|nr:porin family protein [Xanthomonadales bacterium]